MEFVHEYRDHVSVWAFVPLTPCWEPGTVDLEPTTTECVEAIFESMISGTEFVSTGMMKFTVLSRFFGRQPLGGSHPNCESATLLISDGQRYYSISRYLRVPLSELLVRLRTLDRELVARGNELPEHGLPRLFFDVQALFSVLRLMASAVNLSTLFGKRAIRAGMMAVIDLLRGRKIDRILKERTQCRNILTLLTIPYEDAGGLEDARLKDCPAVFAYEDTDTGRIRTTAFCSWQTVKDDVCRKIQARYDEGKPVDVTAHAVSQKNR